MRLIHTTGAKLLEDLILLFPEACELCYDTGEVDTFDLETGEGGYEPCICTL